MEANRYRKIKELLLESKEPQILLSDISNKIGTIDELNKRIDDKELSEEEKEQVLIAGKPVILKRNDKKIFAEPFYPKERMLIFGGGHVALPLVSFAKKTGFYIVVMDDREEFSNKGRFPEADEVFSGSYEECIKNINPSKSDYCIIITRGHAQDELCIRELFEYDESVYTGLIGSKKRTKVLFERLREEGFDSNRMQRICTPIGLPIGAQTTEEIGISIMAEVIQRKRLESADNKWVNRSDLDHDMLEILQEKERCAVATIMSSTGSVPRKEGAKMLIQKDGSIKGTIGGGKIESTVIEKGKSIIGAKKYEILDVQLDGTDASAEGMICGGAVTILLEEKFD